MPEGYRIHGGVAPTKTALRSVQNKRQHGDTGRASTVIQLYCRWAATLFLVLDKVGKTALVKTLVENVTMLHHLHAAQMAGTV